MLRLGRSLASDHKDASSGEKIVLMQDLTPTYRKKNTMRDESNGLIYHYSLISIDHRFNIEILQRVSLVRKEGIKTMKGRKEMQRKERRRTG